MPPKISQNKPGVGKAWTMGTMAINAIQPMIKYKMVERMLKRPVKNSLNKIPKMAMLQTIVKRDQPQGPAKVIKVNGV
jgi:hypothetical protein